MVFLKDFVQKKVIFKEICWFWSGTKLFCTLMVFLKEFVPKKVIFKEKSADAKKSLQNYPACKEF